MLHVHVEKAHLRGQPVIRIWLRWLLRRLFGLCE